VVADLDDPPFTVEQTRRVGDWIERSGKRLTYIYVTHGHGPKDPGRANDSRILDETAEYLHTARQVIAEKPTAREFFDVMTRRYPDRLNPGTVWLNAQRLA
jgi:hypothetical protein